MGITQKESLHKKQILAEIIERLIRDAGSGHYASSMSALDIMYPLFYREGIRPNQFILSKGHGAPALYAILYDLGYLTDADLQRFRKAGGLPGHPSIAIPGVTVSSGSLGMGISKAIGLAYANPGNTYYVLVGDGETQEGQIWESLLFLRNRPTLPVIVYIDVNKHQYSGTIPDRMQLDPWIVGDPRICFHYTEWRKDNSYLCKPPSRKTEYAAALVSRMADDPRIVVLDADLKYDFCLQMVSVPFHDRFIECGICEQHMVSMANGLALAGEIPICHTFGAFYRRCVDQMWNNVCDNLPVGYVAGLIDHGDVNIGESHEAVDGAALCALLSKHGNIHYTTSIPDFFEMLADRRSAYLEII